MHEEGVSSEKAALRRRFRAVRAGVPGRIHAAIVARVLALPETDAARSVLAFWPLVARGEVDVRPLVRALVGRGVAVALPAVVPGGAPRLVARAYAGALVPGPWGLSEPPESAPPAGRLDIVVVPALALGRDGSRLGYGGGYYDAFLATTDALRVGVVPHACLAETLPAEAHDARLDVVVTEAETVRVTPQAASLAEGRARNAAEPAP